MSGCALPAKTPQSYLISQNITPPEGNTFPHCYNYGCQRVVDVELSQHEWQTIKTEFGSPAQNAADERNKISGVIGTFEEVVGEKTGTKVDKFGTFRNMGNFHHDCVDESTNTTVYLMLLQERGLLRFHDVSAPDSRLPLFHGGRWPHRTAVIHTKQGTEQYAVDSWFHDNGYPAEVVSMTFWKKGWKPEKNFTRGSDSNPQK